MLKWANGISSILWSAAKSNALTRQCTNMAPGEKDLATQFQDAFVSTLGALQGNQSYHFTRKASQQQDGDFAAAEWPMLSDFFNLHFGCKLKPVTFFNLLHESGHKLVRKTYRTDTKFLIDGKHVGGIPFSISTLTTHMRSVETV